MINLYRGGRISRWQADTFGQNWLSGAVPDEDIANGRNILITGSMHGSEPAGREMALKFMRDLAFTDDRSGLDRSVE